MRKLSLFYFFIFAYITGQQALACDLCSIYSSIELQKASQDTLRFGITEQFTEYGNILDQGHFVHNESHQRLESSITQILAAYDASPSLTIQTTLPYINREFKRLDGDAVQNGAEAGIGDMTIVGRYSVYQGGKADSFYNVQLLAGVKLPTGNSSRLKEELSENHQHAEVIDTRHGTEEHQEMEAQSAIHGHDLALGSGSVDFPLGASIVAQQGKFFARGSAIYSIRTAGDHEYQYADDFMWDFGPGYYLYTQHESTAGVRATLSGENKSKDSGRDGEIQHDTGISTLFLGPEVNFSVANSLSGALGYDIPLDINNTGYQAVASYRIRAGLTYRF